MGDPTDDRRPPISGGTRLAAVIGAPVRHSLSPTLLNTAFAEAGLDWHFMALEVAEGQAGEALDAVRALGLVGLSVTMPHKAAVAAAVDHRTDEAEALDAVNCVVVEEDRLVGHNTDGDGFLDGLRHDAGLDPTGGARCVKALNSVKDRTGFDHTAAHALYRKLFSGLDDAIGDKELQVVVNGPLAALPLSVLVTDLPAQEGESASRRTQWLALRNAVTVLPSLAMLRLRDTAKAPTPGTGFVGFGDPAFAGNASENATTRAGRAAILSELAPLPGTRREIEAIASIFPSEARDIRLGEAATEAAVRGADLTGHGVVAFATHGLLAGDLGADSEPGLAFTRTGSTAEDDGFLTASEAATLEIDADWLLLSACNTAASDGDPDSGGYSGLARAFLFAGARSILVSHWPVRDDAAPALTVSAIKWLRENPSESPARALQQAMVEMIRSPQLPGHADPSAWAPFVLFSGGR